MSQSTETIELPPCDEAGTPLQLALLESRQRWRQFGALATDLAFETDIRGDLTFMAPEMVLGWRATELLGTPAHTLLADTTGTNPFHFSAPAWRQPTWLLTHSGGLACMKLTIVPMLDESGAVMGLRGIGVNITEKERTEASKASALRRGEVLDQILNRMRQEVLAPRMMRAALDAIMRALGCIGVAVIDLLQTTAPLVLHSIGRDFEGQLETVLTEIAAEDDETRPLILPNGAPALACSCSTRFGDRAALLAWRPPGGRPWDADDLVLAASVSGIVRIVLEHEAIQRELARQARTDPLTGLLNRRAFLEEAARRLDRLEKEGSPGTLLFIDLDRLKQLNDRLGHEAGDAALLVVAALLQRTFRPSDLVARLGGDEFAVWLDGADSLTAAERAEQLRLSAPGELAHLTGVECEPMSMSTGIATREPNSDETLEALMQRADHAMYEVKRSGRGHWRVSHLAPV